MCVCVCVPHGPLFFIYIERPQRRNWIPRVLEDSQPGEQRVISIEKQRTLKPADLFRGQEVSGVYLSSIFLYIYILDRIYTSAHPLRAITETLYTICERVKKKLKSKRGFCPLLFSLSRCARSYTNDLDNLLPLEGNPRHPHKHLDLYVYYNGFRTGVT